MDRIWVNLKIVGPTFLQVHLSLCGRCDSLMISGRCAVFLSKTLLFTLAVPLFTQVYKWLPANLGVEIDRIWVNLKIVGPTFLQVHLSLCGRCDSLMISGRCAVFLSKTLLFTLAVPLFTQVYKWLPANLGVERLLVASCYRNRDKLRPDGPLG